MTRSALPCAADQVGLFALVLGGDSPKNHAMRGRGLLAGGLLLLSSCETSGSNAVVEGYQQRLMNAGDLGAGDPEACNRAVEKVRADLANDTRISTQTIRAEIEHFETVKGPLPMPTPGTACALFGFPKAAREALGDRLNKI